MEIFIAGSGAWATALAIRLVDNGHAVTLWTRREEKAALLRESGENPALAGVPLPRSISVTNDHRQAASAGVLLFAVASEALRPTAALIAPLVSPDCLLISAVKGLEHGSRLRMSQIITEYTPAGCRVAVLSGPSHAEEVSRAMPTGCVAASEDAAAAHHVRTLFQSPCFHIRESADMAGVESCAAWKNVAALGMGIIEGAGMGDNLRALYFTAVMAEMELVCQRLGGLRESCRGPAGLGDLVVTCFSGHSRNRRAGELIGAGAAVPAALREVGAVVEGYRTAAGVLDFPELNIPVLRAVYRVLYESAPPEAIRDACFQIE